MKKFDRRALKEVYEILKYIPDDDYEKIPKDIIDKIEENMDKNYEYEVKTGKEFDDSVMLKDTENLLAYIFKNYWATEEQKDLIKEYKKNKEQLDENKKRIKYNPNNIFNENIKEKQEDKEDEDVKKEEMKSEEETSIVVVKENFFRKLINYFRNLFNF